MVQRVHNEVEATFKRVGLPARLAGRINTPFMLYQKMQRNHLSFAQVTDIYGFRIILPTTTDCYTALGVLRHCTTIRPLQRPYCHCQNQWLPIAAHHAGWPMGVTSIELRTESMHIVAEAGVLPTGCTDPRARSKRR